MLKSLVLSALLLSVWGIKAQTRYFVSQQNGNDSNNGMNASAPFLNISTATALAQPGDTIILMGTFINNSYVSNNVFTTVDDPKYWYGENTIRLNNINGAPNAYITFKPYDANTVLKGDGGNIFRVQNCSYLRIVGFHIQGEVNNLPLSTANALQFVYILGSQTADILDPTPAEIHYRDQDCVSGCLPGVQDGETYSALSPNDVYRPTYFDTRGLYLSNVHHIEILDNHIELMPGGGLRVSDCEDINIIGNEINDCSRKSSGGTHGLVVTKATSTRTTNDYRIRIIGNKVHHNYNEQFSWAPDKIIITPHIDEGKGISMQRNQTLYDGGGNITLDWENGRILIANNICYMNGFSGIHSNDGYRMDIYNNTCYFNSYTNSITENTPSINGGNIGISVQDGGDFRIINNISVIDSLQTKSAISSNLTANEGLVVRNNVIYGITLSGIPGDITEQSNVLAVQVNALKANPMFVDPVNFDFHLQSNSPARSFADPIYAPVDDYYNTLRDNLPDAGAVEYICTPTQTITSEVSCGPYTWPVNGMVYSFPGQFRDTIVNADGCDSVLILNLTIYAQSNVSVIQNSDGSLTASLSGGFYHWLNCADNSVVGTQQTFMPISNGSYAVVYISPDWTQCNDTSNCIVVTQLALNEGDFEIIYFHPNPTSDQVTITMTANSANLRVYDIQGKMVAEQKVVSGSEVSLKEFETGVYLFEIVSEGNRTVKRVVKN